MIAYSCLAQHSIIPDQFFVVRLAESLPKSLADVPCATAGLTVATGKLNSSTSWRVPLAIQIIPAAILLFFSFLLPEVSS